MTQQALKLGGAAYLRYAHAAHGYPWTIFMQAQLNAVGGMLMGVEKAASEGTASVYMSPSGGGMSNYTQTSAGGVPDDIVGGQDAYCNNAALVPIMLVGISTTQHILFTPTLSSGRSFNPQGAGATAADLNNWTDFVLGAWLRNGSAAASYCNTDVAEVAKWLYALDSTHFASLVANAKPETVGNSTVQAAIVDVWDCNPTGSVGAAAPASFTGVVNGLTLSLVGSGATVSSRTDPVTRAAATGPTINTQPANQTVAPGGTFTFSVAATASGGALSYQWQKGTTNISGATSATYSGAAGTDGVNGDTFRCVVTDSNGSTTSSSATLTVGAASMKPSLNFFYRKGNPNV